ncbi:MipA/OmpV family protein [Novosphingobium sp. PASSN1]|uniref:MipA/OmpV family protein n=1 Tax=Novosphingobium sp. PASSN1 TaxID=2015561 RepID=UPI000BCFA33D|nr:MipA/OmpV family protein [Novosphingobium sp. PASSN1]OYU36072.1 MAG: MltA-interacting MipA [Novosphingobium sp. PASSN1]
MNPRSLATLVAAILLAATTAQAQSAPAASPIAPRPAGPPPTPTWTLTVGMVPLVAPAWQGSRDYALSIFPDIRVAYKDVAFASVQEGFGVNVINRDGWKIGPIARLRFGRRESTGGSPFLVTGGSDALRGLGNIGLAGEFGGFVQYSPAGALGRRVALRTEVRQGTGGHEGLVAEPSIRFSDRAGAFRYSLALRSTFASAKYTQVYFGVTPDQAARAGLSAYRTGSGLVSAGIGGTLTRPLGKRGQHGAITLLAGYDCLGNVAADSTLIRGRGRRDQLSVGLAYGYRFTWK